MAIEIVDLPIRNGDFPKLWEVYQEGNMEMQQRNILLLDFLPKSWQLLVDG